MDEHLNARARVRLRIFLSVLALCLLLGSRVAAQTLTVFAASSMTEAVEEIAALLEAQHPGTQVVISLGGSSTLSLQIIQGAPADVFLSANVEQMQRVADAGLLSGEPVLVATNRLVVIAPNGSRLSGFGQLADDGVALVLAGPEVPAGRYSREAINSYDAAEGGGFATAVLANVVSEEQNVRLVATKVELGEADAGIVYATDAATLAGVVVIDVPIEHNPLASYLVAALREAPEPSLARAFIDMLLSAEGMSVLESRGFGPPDP